MIKEGLSTCVRCRTLFHGEHCEACKPGALARHLALGICRTNKCGQFIANPKTSCDHHQHGCRLHPRKSCWLDHHLVTGGGCFADPPLFEAVTIPPRIRPMCAIRIPEVGLPDQQSSLAICTVVIGRQAEQMAHYTLPPIERYARKCNADLIVLTEDHVPYWPIGNKFQFHQVAKRYRRSLLLDIDIVIRSDTPDIFKLYSGGRIWMHEDRSYTPDQWLRDQLRDEVHDIAREHFGSRLQCRDVRQRNTGVCLLDQSFADVWMPPEKALPRSTTAEQSYVEAKILSHGIRTGKLAWSWNWQAYFAGFAEQKRLAYFVHFASLAKNKIPAIKEFMGR